MFKEIQNYVFKCEDSVKIFNHFNNLNIIMYANVLTSTGIKKCEFCEKIVILEWVSAYVILMCCKKQSRTAWRWRGRTSKRAGVKNW
jgi:hypothetical protein